MSAEVECCGLCKKPINQTPPMAAIFLWLPGVKKPFLLSALGNRSDDEDEWVFCRNEGCPSVLIFIRRAIDGNPITRMAAKGWNIAKITFYDPSWPDWRIEPEKVAEVARA